MRTRMYGLKSALAALGLAVAGVATATTAEAATLQWDVNKIAGQANGTSPFSTSFTGDIDFTATAQTVLGMQIVGGTDYGDFGPGTPNPGTVGFTASLDFVNGIVTGGSLTVSFDDGVNPVDTFTADFTAGGNIAGPSGLGNFTINAAFTNGQFSGNTFAGVNVSYWANHPSGQNPWGELIQFGFSPDGSGFDGDTNGDIFVVIPLPAPVWMGLAGLGGVVVLRRRSLRNAA